MNGKKTGKIIFLSALMLLVAALPGCSGRADKETEPLTTTQQAVALITEEIPSSQTAPAATSTVPATTVLQTTAVPVAAVVVTSAAKTTAPRVERVTTTKPATTKATTTAKTTLTVPPVPLKKITELEDVKLETLRYGLMKETHIIVSYMLYSDGSRVDETRTEEVTYNRTNFRINHNELVENAAVDKLKYKADINETVELVNDYRRGYKRSGSNPELQPLTYDDDLTLAACMRAEEIAYSDKFAHERPDGRAPQTVMDDIGYKYTGMGENLGKGYATPEDAFKAWIKSPEHKVNIVDVEFTKIGVGCAVAPDGSIIWVQLFAN